ncbi:hypothetical protein GQ457_16G006530 [Hibiscus cannabinus]
MVFEHRAFEGSGGQNPSEERETRGRAFGRRSWLAGITTGGGNGDGFNARRLGFARILQGQNAQNRRTPHLYFPLTHMKHRVRLTRVMTRSSSSVRPVSEPRPSSRSDLEMRQPMCQGFGLFGF